MKLDKPVKSDKKNTSTLSTEAVKKQTSVFKCQCGANMVYSIKKGVLWCPYCDSTKPILHASVLKRDYEAEKSNGAVVENKGIYECPNCGGIIEYSKYETSLNCAFCGATNMIKSTGKFNPDTILPFKIEKEDAFASGKNWIKKKFFAPSNLRKNFSVDNFKGIYVPSFFFDSNTYSSYEGRIGDEKTKETTVNGQTTTETYIEWRRISGKYNEAFRDEPIEATTQLTQLELSKIMPYDIENIEQYRAEFVSGFVAERHDTSLENAYAHFQKSANNEIRSHILSKYSYDKLDYLNVYTSFENSKFRYTLLPIWMCSYTFKKKLFNFIVNGRTGKATGKAPVSPLKVAILVFIILAIIASIVCGVIFGTDSSQYIDGIQHFIN